MDCTFFSAEILGAWAWDQKCECANEMLCARLSEIAPYQQRHERSGRTPKNGLMGNHAFWLRGACTEAWSLKSLWEERVYWMTRWWNVAWNGFYKGSQRWVMITAIINNPYSHSSQSPVLSVSSLLTPLFSPPRSPPATYLPSWILYDSAYDGPLDSARHSSLDVLPLDFGHRFWAIERQQCNTNSSATSFDAPKRK